jgi:hypothetical protein
MKRTIGLWTFWGAVLVSFPLPRFRLLQRGKSARFRERIIRIADHKSFEDKKRPLDREDGGNDHHQENEHNFSFAEFAFVGPRWLGHFRLIERHSRFAALRIVAGRRWS